MSRKLKTYAEISGAVKILVSRSSWLALVKLVRLTVVLELKPIAGLGKVKADIAVEFLRGHKCGKKEKENSDSHLEQSVSRKEYKLRHHKSSKTK